MAMGNLELALKKLCPYIPYWCYSSIHRVEAWPVVGRQTERRNPNILFSRHGKRRI
jgi:hypothetical protein